MTGTPTGDRSPAEGGTSHDELAVSAGAYVLGALSPADREVFARHLPQCPSCRAAVDELAGLPGLLSHVPASQVTAQGERAGEAADDVPALPASLLTDLLREVRRARRRRRWVVAAVAGAAAAALVVVGIAIGRPASDPGPARQAMVSAAPSSLTATVALSSVDWGTRIDLACRYDDAVRGSVPYSLVVRDRAGRVEQLGTWTAVPGKVASMQAATDIRRADIAAVEVRSPSGRTVLHLVGPAGQSDTDVGPGYG